ncbi:hypothetical protein VKT23_007454 [Stygiomarasmius scandens]|uniref:DUF6589 domain-containing protein n=1 Tax=Marasmiellus scandens TaxID=2682957 RepID=A0ABR1JM21_9AGAR
MPRLKRRNSDTGYKPPESVKKKLKIIHPPIEPESEEEVQETSILPNFDEEFEASPEVPNSSLPGSPRFEDDEPLPSVAISPLLIPTTPHRQAGPSAVADSSPLAPSPAVLRGRPRVNRPHRNPRGGMELHQQAEWEDKLQEAQMRQAVEESAAQLAAKVQEREDREAREMSEVDDAHEVFRLITRPKSEGGFGFLNMKQFYERLFGTGSSRQMKANITRWCKEQGADLSSRIFERAPKAFEDFMQSSHFGDRIRKEGEAIQKLLTRPPNTKINDLLDEFSVQKLAEDLQRVAPTMWGVLTSVSSREGESRRNKELVFTAICAMLSVVRSQKANNFQVIMGLFLLGSGAAKREIAVFAQAGLSVNYSSVIEHVKALSEENLRIIRQVVKKFMCSIAWDNINFAFRVESQRLTSKDHFDSGTTTTLIVQQDPETNAPASHGTLPLDMKPPRMTMKQIINNHSSLLLPSVGDAQKLDECSLWQLKQIALEHKPELSHLKNQFPPCPSIEQIAPHITQQYPLPAMHEDESSIDGTINVYDSIMRNLDLSNEDMHKHGLMFTDGDLLTDSLVDKVESARRNSTEPLEGMKTNIRRFGLFHCKLNGARMVVNQHWGKPNSPWPGSLWWEHTNLLERKPMSAGWQSKKSAPWKQSHELLQISLIAHILDGFRIHCGHQDFDTWASGASLEEFNTVAEKVYYNLFTSAAFEKESEVTDSPDIIFMNNILYNRDVLYYWLLVTSIKAGDIGRVILVLRVWMVMMRAPKTMPRYANAIFETLGRLQEYPEKLRKMFLHNWLVNLTGKANGFKEVDLLQEHTNFWIKVIYNAKGVNRSWEWLSMISVCIYSLRDAMRKVQSSFNIPVYGTRHTIPDMSNEIRRIADKLQEEKIQEHISSRPANSEVEPVRDLLSEGSAYANKRTAFARYRENDSILENAGFQGEPFASARDSDDDDDEQEEEYQLTPEDLAMDEEEPIEMAEELVQTAISMMEAGDQ